MANLRSEISNKSPYYISKHRYLELKHFCLQYPEWKEEINKINWYGRAGDGRSSDISDRVSTLAAFREKFLRQMEIVEQTALNADGDIYEWILKSVCYGVSYNDLRTAGIPCSKDYFYDRYRRFFYLLDRVR